MDKAEIVIYVVTLAGIVGAFVVFFMTPKDKRYTLTLTRPGKEEGVDYAPEYTKRERTIIVIKILAVAAPLYIGTYYWFFPWLGDYAKHAHCYKYGAYTGIHVLFYGLLVGMPLLFALVLFAIEGVRQIKVFRLGQFPLPGQKVLTPTKYVYGFRARLISLLFFVILLALVVTSIRGFYWARELTDKPIKDNQACVDV